MRLFVACAGKHLALFVPLLSAGLLAGCDRADEADWQVSGRGGDTVMRLSSGGEPRVSLACLRDQNVLELSVPSFRPVDSAEELALGIDEDSHLLVVDPQAGQGVVGQGPIPAEFLARLVDAREIRIVYAAQRLDGIPAPARDIAMHFIRACYPR